MAKAKSKPAKPKDQLQPTHISVTFTIVTPDQLRKIIFTLVKLSDANNDSWSIMFELDERADAANAFQLVIQLQVDVDHNDAPKAAATAKNGLDSDQHSQALAAADTAKDVKTGDATKADLGEDTKGIVSARNDASPS
jgi:hypothetical protein